LGVGFRDGRRWVREPWEIEIVTRKTNPKYYDLIRAFYELTGVAVLVNTSFNVKEEPIVDSPQEAIDCFLKTGIDFLVLSNCVSVKDGLQFRRRQLNLI